MEQTLYHKFLRTAALTLSLVLLFQSGILSPLTRELSDGTGRYVATAISMNASVTPNEINTLSAQLEQQKQALDQREIAVKLKEDSAGNTSNISTFILSVVLFILLVLVVLNYVLDYIRGRAMKITNEQTA
jgi:hypothetical protein